MNAPTGGSAYHATDGVSYEVFLGRWTRRLAEPLLDFAGFPAAGDLLVHRFDEIDHMRRIHFC